jgi:hypothetical protein
VVIASDKPLDEADEEAKRALDDIRKPAAKSKKKKKPMVLSLKTRGLMLVGQDADKSMKAKTDEKGVALFRFSFKHTR